MNSLGRMKAPQPPPKSHTQTLKTAGASLIPPTSIERKYLAFCFDIEEVGYETPKPLNPKPYATPY